MSPKEIHGAAWLNQLFQSPYEVLQHNTNHSERNLMLRIASQSEISFSEEDFIAQNRLRPRKPSFAQAKRMTSLKTNELKHNQ